MIFARGNHWLKKWNNYLYAIGGCFNYHPINNCEKYCPIKNKWYNIPSLNKQMTGPTIGIF